MCDHACRVINESPTGLGCITGNGGSSEADDNKQAFSCSCKLPRIGENCETKQGEEMFQ